MIIKRRDKGGDYMFITINGHLGSGKSTVCSLLKNKYGFDVFSSGSIQRQIARKMNASTLDLNKISENDYSIDRYIDKVVVEFAENNIGESVVFDSRLAWHFVPNTFKVRLTINPVTAAERIVFNRCTLEESYDSLEDAIDQLSERQKSESLRYKLNYNVDINDSNNYDLIVDTSQLSPEEVCDTIYEAYCHFCKKTIEKHIINMPKTNAFINTAVVTSGIHTVIDKLQNVFLTSVDEILNNEITSFRNKISESPNKRLVEKEVLVIDSFETCNGKETTQRILYEIITMRMLLRKPTLIISNIGIHHLSAISSDLFSIVKTTFELLP